MDSATKSKLTDAIGLRVDLLAAEIVRTAARQLVEQLEGVTYLDAVDRAEILAKWKQRYQEKAHAEALRQLYINACDAVAARNAAPGVSSAERDESPQQSFDAIERHAGDRAAQAQHSAAKDVAISVGTSPPGGAA